MKTKTRDEVLAAIRADGRYPPDAFDFLNAGVEHTTRKIHGEDQPHPRHVTGQELCTGLRELAVQRWGRLARLVLNRWNIHCTRDFGEMVYFLISLGLMGRQDSDCIEDFDNVYSFHEAFDRAEVDLDAREP